jgi:hypothetical protein
MQNREATFHVMFEELGGDELNMIDRYNSRPQSINPVCMCRGSHQFAISTEGVPVDYKCRSGQVLQPLTRGHCCALRALLELEVIV